MNEIIREDLKNICAARLDWGKLKNSTILITGSNGMLASYMVFTLLQLNVLFPELNIKVIALARSMTKARKRFAEFLGNPGLALACREITRKLRIKGPVDYIIHAASPASSQFFAQDPVGVILPNVLGTQNLLELAREKNSKGFLFFSSGEVCGKVDKKILAEEDAGYLDPTDLRSCYGESKRMGENMCQAWFRQYGVPTFAVRPDHTYGPTMDLKNDQRVFAEFVRDVVDGRNLRVKSDGRAMRTFCYLSDATDGFFRVLLKGKAGQSYNVSNNRCRISIGELADSIAGLFPEKKLEVIYAKRKKNTGYLENKDKLRPALSTAKIEKLGYRPGVGIEEGFRRCIKSFLSKEG